jgi:ferredoxin
VKVIVNPVVCEGHGRCYELAPDIYKEDERGHCSIENEEVPPDLEEIAGLAARSCPEKAITVVDG